jgi:hypothetical protein
MKRTPFWSILILLACIGHGCSEQQPDSGVARLTIPDAQAATAHETFAVESKTWQFPEGTWIRRTVAGINVLAQTAVDRVYPLAIWQDKRYVDVDLSVRFKPISGSEDASGGLIFRARDARNYLIVRANALEDNVRLYTVIDGTRRQIATKQVTPPALGTWHTLRVIAVGTRIQAELDGKLLIDHTDATYAEGYVGLWTKADSVSEFSDFTVRGTIRDSK